MRFVRADERKHELYKIQKQQQQQKNKTRKIK